MLFIRVELYNIVNIRLLKLCLNFFAWYSHSIQRFTNEITWQNVARWGETNRLELQHLPQGKESEEMRKPNQVTDRHHVCCILCAELEINYYYYYHSLFPLWNWICYSYAPECSHLALVIHEIWSIYQF